MWPPSSESAGGGREGEFLLAGPGGVQVPVLSVMEDDILNVVGAIADVAGVTVVDKQQLLTTLEAIQAAASDTHGSST